jgi:hypothetical protein
MRLIDADALKKQYYPFPCAIGVENAVTIRAINEAPTIDAMPVVRCKECEDYNTTGRSKGFGWCESMDRGVSDDFYCANGAKMEARNE